MWGGCGQQEGPTLAHPLRETLGLQIVQGQGQALKFKLFIAKSLNKTAKKKKEIEILHKSTSINSHFYNKTDTQKASLIDIYKLNNNKPLCQKNQKNLQVISNIT